MKKSHLILLSIIIFLGAGVRAVNLNVPYFDDEADFMTQINSIDLKERTVPLAAVGHSPLSLYITKFSSLVFGKTRVGHRAILLILNVLLIFLLYVFARQKSTHPESLFSALLISLNSFVIFLFP